MDAEIAFLDKHDVSLFLDVGANTGQTGRARIGSVRMEVAISEVLQLDLLLRRCS